MEVVVIVVNNGDDNEKDTSLCISTQSQKKIAIRDTAREKSERLKVEKKNVEVAIRNATVFKGKMV
jgi:hypothetical protein